MAGGATVRAMAGLGPRFIDIGANLTDGMYRGEYHGSSRHPADLGAVLARAREAGVDRIIVTGGSLAESEEAVSLAKEHPQLSATVGCHPTRCDQFLEAEGGPEAYLEGLARLARDNRGQVVAIGELGLDYDRTQFCSPDTQRRFLVRQLELSEATGLPLFLHSRAAAGDLVDILSQHRDKVPAGGVVHSFDGSAEDRDRILALGLHIGVNGCSLKTEENLAVVAGVPEDRLLLETDCPWCEVRPSHAGHKLLGGPSWGPSWTPVDKKKWKEGAVVKGRNEPHNIRQVLEIVAAVRQAEPLALAGVIYSNTERLFFAGG